MTLNLVFSEIFNHIAHMKRIFLLLLITAIGFHNLSAQTTVNPSKPQPDSRLFDVFDRAYIERLVTEDPFTIERWNFYLDHAFYIDEIPAEKDMTINLSHYPSVEIADLAHINIFKLEQVQKIHPQPDLENIYHIAGTNKLLMYKRSKDFNSQLNSKLRRSY